MKARTKVWLIIATALVLFGCGLFAGVMTRLEWDFTKLSTVKYENNTYEISEVFGGISMNTDTADIVFAYSDDDKCRVVCHEQENAKHSVTVENGTLTVALVDERSVYNFIGLNFGFPKITVYLPKAEYTSLFIKESTGNVEIPTAFTFKNADISLSTGDVDFYASATETVKIKTSTGDICVKNSSAGDLDLSVSTGKVKLSDIACKNLTSSGNTGDISLNHVVATEKFFIERSTGDVKIDRCDAAEIFIKTDTGDVTGSLLSEKVFVPHTDTGSVQVPKTVNGGKCEISTDTGDIKIAID